jgi:hypothetical protein
LGQQGKSMFTGRRSGWLALGISLALHGLPVCLVCLFSPRGASHAGVSAFAIDTRGGPPRSMTLSLWEEPKAGSPAKAVEAAATGSTPRPEPFNTGTVKVPEQPQTKISPQPADESTDFVVKNSAMAASDYAALAAGAGSGSKRNMGGMPGNGETSSAGGRGGIGLLRVPRPVQSVVFVVDGSSSMGNMGPGGSFERAKRELITSIEALPATTRFQVIVYNRSASPLRINGHTDLVPASEPNKRAAFELICQLDPEGSTNHFLAMQQAIILQPEAILFVTDGDGLRADQVRALTVLNRGRSSIDTFELTRRPQRERSALQILAEQNHGGFRRASIEER